jgi:hypothetical protein
MSLTTYFQEIGYKHTYELGDRVGGSYKGIPFVGSVGSDTLRSEDEGPMVSVHLDLPMKVDGEIRSIIRVQHKDIKLRKQWL